MPSSNADSPDITNEDVIDRYGYDATEYVKRVALAELHPDPRAWDAFDVNAPGEAAQGRRNDETRRLAALAFANSDGNAEAWGAFRGYLGRQAQQFIDNGLVDSEVVRKALVAAA